MTASCRAVRAAAQLSGLEGAGYGEDALVACHSYWARLAACASGRTRR
ncbi:hypothetical protein SGL43_03561 [Streptomyces globisporus]|uniref:Uncharacterized protein n=1 Tax=Streptomyces globisporus TaxID=1908 RepID=A0ABM9GY21_STRGL|nr:hypothetical protein SGL43_03561 [Streptomyces globisporus]